MKKITLISIAVSLACASFVVNAKKPHPTSPYDIADVTCACDWVTVPNTCTVSWTHVGAPSYGVDVEFEAEWLVDGVEMKSTAKLDLDDDWMCEEIGTCTANGEFVLPEYSGDADIKFVGKVKGFDTGPGGSTPRDFIKATGACNLPLPL
jgi:hypothetical protein